MLDLLKTLKILSVLPLHKLQHFLSLIAFNFATEFNDIVAKRYRQKRRCLYVLELGGPGFQRVWRMCERDKSQTT